MSDFGKSRLFQGGTVWLGPDQPDATALLVVNGRISAIGADAVRAATESFGEADADLEVVDLAGGFLMPAFGDGHAHPMYGALEDAGPRVRACANVDEIVAEVGRYAAEHPDDEWIIGASYNGSLAPDGLFDARWLDVAVPDRPVMLRAWDYHTVWCNSKALELAGIDANTPEPELGEIPRRGDGSPLGTLREWGAIDLVTAVSPGYTLDQMVDALGRSTAYFASLGVTWVQDAWVEHSAVDVYIEAARRGVLKTRLNLALLADPRDFPESLPALIDARAKVEDLNHPMLTAHSVKFFADGVIENETGALLEPYCTGLHDHGMLVWTPENLAAAAQIIDEARFQIHIHAIGDAAVQTSLDAIAHADRVNGAWSRRAVIAHVQLATKDDLRRFAELGVIATMQPLWAQLDALMTVLTLPRLGPERSDQQYRMRTVGQLGATLAFGSDWPVSSAAPLDGIGIAVSRTTAEGDPVGGWTPQETLDIDTALLAYTRGVALQAYADHSAAPWGNIETDASADLVWLADDPRRVRPAALPAIGIRATYLAGEITYSAV